MSDDTRERSRHAARDASAPPNGSDGNQTMIQPDGHLNAEMVSAWLDTPDDFNEQELLTIETHLAGCAECRQIAAELTAIVRAFRALPYVDVPHAFALTPEQAGLTATPTLPAAARLEEPAHPHERRLERESRKPVPLYEPTPWYERQMRALRWATAAAAMLFVFLISADVIGNIETGGDDDDDDSAPMSVAGSIPTQASGTGAAEATNTTSAAMAEPEENEQDGERNSDAQSTPASGSDDATGGAPEPTTAPDSSQETPASTDDAVDEQEEVPPASANTEATTEDAETRMTMETAEPGQADLDAQLQQDNTTVSGYSTKDAITENQESNTLHLIELALVILIAWLIVGMVALPRLRRPAG